MGPLDDLIPRPNDPPGFSITLTDLEGKALHLPNATFEFSGEVEDEHWNFKSHPVSHTFSFTYPLKESEPTPVYEKTLRDLSTPIYEEMKRKYSA